MLYFLICVLQSPCKLALMISNGCVTIVEIIPDPIPEPKLLNPYPFPDTYNT